MVKGENEPTDNRRKSLTVLPKIQEGTMENQNEGVQCHEPGTFMPSVDECRYLDDQGQHVDADKLHHYHHYRTISEREQFEQRVQKGSVTMKDLEILQERLALEKHNDKNILEGMSDSIQIEGML